MANKKVSQLTSKPSVLTTDLFPIADPSTGQLFKTTISDLGTAIGSGVSSVNSLVGAVVLDTDDIQELVSPTNKWFTDTRARAALSASSPLTYNSGTGAFGIQVATGSQNGYLSSADWTTFNAKQAALSGTGFVKSTGGTISYDTNTYLTTSAAASTYLALAGGTMTGVLFGASASFSGYVGFGGNTSPLYQVDVTGSGRFSGDLRIESTNPRIYLTDTDNNPDYFISNTDGTFTVYDVTNSAARFTIGTTGNVTFTNAITGGGSITGQSLYSNGIISAGTSLSVGTFVSAGGSLTGSALYVTGMTAGNGAIYHTGSRLTFANYNTSGTLHFEVNGGTGALTINADTSASFVSGLSTGGQIALNSGFGTSTPAISIYNNNGASASNIARLEFRLNNSFGGNERVAFITALNPNAAGNNGGALAFSTSANGTGTTPTERVRIDQSGNVGIGTTSPSNKLEVNGSVKVSDNSLFGLRASFDEYAIQYRDLDFRLIGSNDSGTQRLFSFGYYTSNNIAGTWNSRATINSYTGAATFSSNVTASKLIVDGASNGNVSQFALTRTDSSWGIFNETDLRFYQSNSNTSSPSSVKMVITSSGNVGIGNTTGPEKLSVNGNLILLSGYQIYGNSNSGSTSSYLSMYNGTDGGIDLMANYTTSKITFGTAGTERMRITSGGNVLIGQTTASGSTNGIYFRVGIESGFIVTNDIALQLGRLGSTGDIQSFYTGTTRVGTISVSGSATSYNTTSDYRLKQDLKSFNGLEVVNKIKTYDYEWKADNTRSFGVLAHELQEVLPYAVMGIKDGETMQGVDYSKIVPVLVQAIKELKSKIETLENK